ncbi:hypothetical protein Z043_122444 [Scleropages formosus]|uniref:Uncharacterized protein n=1 Tax=Scleropages formosus TaxID=113540 RepID=A0A0P7W9J7_SCLFO|nr:hypothetical protein Z043_122444 [Scleropages formosus]
MGAVESKTASRGVQAKTVKVCRSGGRGKRPWVLGSLETGRGGEHTPASLQLSKAWLNGRRGGEGWARNNWVKTRPFVLQLKKGGSNRNLNEQRKHPSVQLLQDKCLP